ncbi:amidohydrolase family protein [Variovorax sp. J31P207]|uniref:amidohydrolase family protein n=1 Tax=Variovorax sp. J31P207 TaxID=3053510 RepID=UPI002577C4F9|nr:amidohydrolase family protein [Variovorax sp. J31P207]MDM0068077.1 amidohydrolase family protein [Variovorax sp. J31P207]
MNAMPEGACDCHVHVYDHGYPLAPTATFKPPHAPADAYRAVQRSLGLSRVVVVQPTGYGFDNRCTLAALAQLGPGARGIAVLPPAVPDDDLAQLHAAGIRGVRYMMGAGGLLPWDSLQTMAARIAPLDWNINLQLDGRTLPQHEATLARLPARLVIDHIGKFLGPVDGDSECFAALLRLLDAGRCWIKLSAPYESSRSGPPDYADIAPLARTLASRYPERCLWASNWPHPNVAPAPTEASLLAWSLQWTPEDAARRRMLVDNPAALYGF